MVRSLKTDSMQACWPSATICDGIGGDTRVAEKTGRESARDGQFGGDAPEDAQGRAPTNERPRSPPRHKVVSVDWVISVDSQHVARIDSAHVCQFQLADMAELADNQPPVNDRPERQLKPMPKEEWDA